MPRSYNDDLRWRIVWMHLYMNKDAVEVADVMKVSPRTVYRYSERYLLTGVVRPFLKRSGPLPELSEFEVNFLVGLALSKPGIYLKELQEELELNFYHWVDISTICRALHRVGMTRQVIKHYAIQRSELERQQFWLECNTFDPALMVWIDESGFDRRNSQRKYGYGIRGLPPRNFSLQIRGKRYTAIAILSTEGIEDVYITDEKVNGDVFLYFVRKYLLHLLMPFDGYNHKSVVVLDNASIHHVDRVIETIQSVGAIVRFLPPYSPDMNPIEEVFAESWSCLD